MSLRMQRRIAADLMKCGENRVRFDPERLEEVEDAITRAGIRRLIKDGVIYAAPEKGQTRLRVKEKRGPARRRGGKHSVISRKRRWIMRVRAQRRALASLRDGGRLARDAYRKAYLQVKAGRFKSVADLMRYLEEGGLIKGPLT